MTRRSAPPDERYEVLVERLAHYLAHGQPGTRIPGSTELAHRFGVTGEQISAALTELCRRHRLRLGPSGWLQRTRFLHAHLRWPHPCEPDQFLDPHGWSLRHHTRALRHRTPPNAIAVALGLAPKRPALYLARLTLADDDPAARNHTWIHPHHAHHLESPSAGDEQRTLAALLTHHGLEPHLAAVQVDIRPATPRTARYLRLTGHPPTPQVSVTYRTAERHPLAHSTTWIHPDYFHLTLTTGDTSSSRAMSTPVGAPPDEHARIRPVNPV